MTPSAFQRLSDLHEENGMMNLCIFRLAAGRLKLGIHILKLLRGNKGHIPAKLGTDIGKLPFQLVGGIAYGTDNALYRVL